MKDKKKLLDDLRAKPTTTPEDLARVEHGIDIIHVFNEFPLTPEELENLHKFHYDVNLSIVATNTRGLKPEEEEEADEADADESPEESKKEQKV